MPMTPQGIEAWRTLRDGWLAFAVDLKNGLDVEPFQQHVDAREMRYIRGHLAHFLHALQTARTPAERASIVGEAKQYLTERNADFERQAALAALEHRQRPAALESGSRERSGSRFLLRVTRAGG
jgi:hypothetical protein